MARWVGYNGNGCDDSLREERLLVAGVFGVINQDVLLQPANHVGAVALAAKGASPIDE